MGVLDVAHTLPFFKPLRYSCVWSSTLAERLEGGLARAFVRAWCRAGMASFSRGITEASSFIDSCGEKAQHDATGRRKKISSGTDSESNEVRSESTKTCTGQRSGLDQTLICAAHVITVEQCGLFPVRTTGTCVSKSSLRQRIALQFYV